MAVMAWTLDQWVERVAQEAEQRERWVGPDPRRVEGTRVYGYEQYRDGWHALWEKTEVRCGCGAVEIVPWRPGHRNGKHGVALKRVQAVECWECGEVLDLRLERRDRDAEEGREPGDRRGRRQTTWGKDRRGRWTPRAPRYVVGKGQRRAGAPAVEVAPVEVVQPVVDKAARRAEAIRRARAYKGGIRFIVGGVSKAWRAARG